MRSHRCVSTVPFKSGVSLFVLSLSLFQAHVRLLELNITLAAAQPTQPCPSFSADDYRSIRASYDGHPTTVVQGAGASFPARFYADAIFAFALERGEEVFASYVPTGSGKGKCRIKEFCDECDYPADSIRPTVIDFAGSDSLLKESEYAAFPDLQMYPAVAGAVVPIFNVPNFPTDRPLVLTRTVLARIFRQCANATLCPGDTSIHTWAHPDILALNNGSVAAVTALEAAGDIDIVVRSDGSGTTEIFKKALSAFDAAFAVQIGPLSDRVWDNVAITSADGNAGVVARVLSTPGTMGYSVLGDANAFGARIAALAASATRPEDYVEASPSAITFAVTELGLNFGNNGDPPSRLTADIHNANGFKAWPIAGYSYFVMRRTTVRPGATCANRLATLELLESLLTSSIAATLAGELGFASLPPSVSEYVLGKLRNHLLCDGAPVYVPAPDTRIVLTVHVLSAIAPTMGLFEELYNFDHELDRVQFIERPDDAVFAAAALVPAGPAAGSAALLLTRNLPHTEGVLRIPLIGLGLALVYNLGANDPDPLVLTFATVADILTQDVTTWNQVSSSLPAQPIKVFVPPGTDVVLLEFFRVLQQRSRRSSPIVLGGTVVELPSDVAVRAAVYSTPYSIAFTPFVGNMYENLAGIAAIGTNAANALQPSVDSIAACASAVSYTKADETFDFDVVQPHTANCYGLSTVLTLAMQATFVGDECNSTASAGPATARLAEWLTLGTGVQDPLRVSLLAPLAPVLAELENRTDAMRSRLLRLTCDGVPILAEPTEDKNLISPAVQWTGWGLAIGSQLLCVGFGLWMTVHINTRIVRFSSPPFMYQILVGAMISCLAIVPLGMQDDGPFAASTGLLNSACMAIPFLISIGGTVTHAALLLKTWRIVVIFNNPRLRQLFITDRKLLIMEVGALIIVLGVNVAWIAVDPLHWERAPLSYYDGTAVASRSVGGCTSRCSEEVMLAIGLLLGLSVLYGNVLAYRSRKTPSEFNESKWIALSLMVLMEGTLPIFQRLLATYLTDLS